MGFLNRENVKAPPPSSHPQSYLDVGCLQDRRITFDKVAIFAKFAICQICKCLKVMIWGEDLAEKCQSPTLPVFMDSGKEWTREAVMTSPNPDPLTSCASCIQKTVPRETCYTSFLGGIYRKVGRRKYSLCCS